MATKPEGNPRERIAWLSLFGLAGVAGMIALVIWWGQPPQMGIDENVFRTVDALYTAVRSESPARVSQCEQRLNQYREQGSLPKPAHEFLAGVIARTKKGEWEPAAKRLYDFMLAQRRDGPTGSK